MLAIIQVAIGLIFVYSLLSVLATTINGVVSNILNWRAKYLRDGLIDLLSDPDIQAQFLSHPLIRVVSAPMVTPDETDNPADARAMAAQVSSTKVTNVTWINPKTFAQVLTSLLTEKADLTLYGPLLVAINNLPESPQKFHMLDLAFGLQSAGIGLPEMRAAIQALPTGMQAAMLAALQPIEERRQEAQLNDTEGSRLLPLLEGLRRVNDDAFRRALKVIVASAQTLDEAQTNLEAWFDQRMNIVTDLYKQRLVLFSLIIGLLLAFVLNADSLQMARALWDDPGLRATIVSAANGAIASGQLEQQINQLLPATATPTTQPTPDATQELGIAIIPQAEAATATPNAPSNEELAIQFQDTLNQLLNLNLPIGWEYTPIDGGCQQGESNPPACSSMRNIWLFNPGNNPDWFGLILRKLIGGIVTMIAVAQGAPFWFDLLQRLVRSG